MIILNDSCDTYLFCLWKKSIKQWNQIEKIILKNYKLIIKTRINFPNSLDFCKKFYNNEKLIGGYNNKLNDISGKCIVLIVKDIKDDDIEKLYNIKKQIRNLSIEKDDYNFIHSSQTNRELLNQIELIKGLL